MRKFSDIYPNATPKAVSLLEQLLLFDPEKRLTVEQCLSHPFLDTLHDPADEPGGLGNLDFTWEGQIGGPAQAKLKLKVGQTGSWVFRGLGDLCTQSSSSG